MLRPYKLRSTLPSALFPIARRGRNLHLRHHSVGEPGLRCKLWKLNQLENHLPLTFRFDTAQRAIGEMHGSGGREETLRPQLDFFGIEMQSDVSHLGSYGPVSALVSFPAIIQITTQFITGPMDIGFDRPQGQVQRFGDFLVGIPLHVA